LFDGKNKAVTFSFDDGIEQDYRVIEILDKYKLKGTFNLNTGLFNCKGTLDLEGVTVPFNRLCAAEIKQAYNNHEVAVHTVTHPNLTQLSTEEIVKEVEEDRKYLSELCGYEVVGMAYPCGGVNNDRRVAEILKNYTGVKYSRTITSTGDFKIQDNLYRFNPTAHFINYDEIFLRAEEFLKIDSDEPQLFYIWGHAFELDIANTWDRFEDFCKLISGHSDVFYGTNRQVLLQR
jgi:peptidoglycan/xylan/chitin deacetylase (PgdA/CDA1 family)